MAKLTMIYLRQNVENKDDIELLLFFNNSIGTIHNSLHNLKLVDKSFGYAIGDIVYNRIFYSLIIQLHTLYVNDFGGSSAI